MNYIVSSVSSVTNTYAKETTPSPPTTDVSILTKRGKILERKPDGYKNSQSSSIRFLQTEIYDKSNSNRL
jgi:hypothetical protein